jgi:hypothetical protein
LLLSWLAPGGGRGIVALDLLNCTSVQSAPSPTHPVARDDVGTLAARHQSTEPNSQPLMEMLVPFQMMYADGVERLAAESLLERQKWVNRIWYVVFLIISLLDSDNRIGRPSTSQSTYQILCLSHGLQLVPFELYSLLTVMPATRAMGLDQPYSYPRSALSLTSPICNLPLAFLADLP